MDTLDHPSQREFLPGDLIIERWSSQHENRWLFLEEDCDYVDGEVMSLIYGCNLTTMKREGILCRDLDTRWITNPTGFWLLRDGVGYPLWR